jgi:hypothetical protein
MLGNVTQGKLRSARQITTERPSYKLFPRNLPLKKRNLPAAPADRVC